MRPSCERGGGSGSGSRIGDTGQSNWRGGTRRQLTCSFLDCSMHACSTKAHHKAYLEKAVRRGQIPKARKTQVVPSPADGQIDGKAGAEEDLDEKLIHANFRRSTSEMLHEASRETCSGCLLMFIEDFNLCCDNVYDFTMGTQSKSSHSGSSSHDATVAHKRALAILTTLPCSIVFPIHGI